VRLKRFPLELISRATSFLLRKPGRLYHDLFAFVFRLLTEPGPKVLTRELLAGEIKVTNAELITAARLREWIDKVDAILERHEQEIKELRTRIPVERARTFYEPRLQPNIRARMGRSDAPDPRFRPEDLGR
jgi:hypothetical protein